MTIEFFVPSLGESITEATLARWIRSSGEYVEQDELICELETDKVAVSVPSPSSGVLVTTLAAEGETVVPGALLGRIDEHAIRSAGAEEEPSGVRSAKGIAGSAASESGAGVAAPLSPAVQRLVREHDLDPAAIKGSGKDGRLLKGDVLAAVEAPSSPPPLSAPLPDTASAPALPASIQGAADEDFERVPMSRLRRTIAQRLKQAQNEAALLTTFNDVDMSAVMELRSRWRDRFLEKHGVRLGFMGFFIKAATHALQAVPGVNARIEGNDILYYRGCSVGVAVAIESGLVVPVIRDAQCLDIAGIERAVADAAGKARQGTLSPGALRGGTFSITNGGVFGSMLSTPIVNPPQSAILGLHRIEERPVVRDGAIVIRPMMYLALSYDHRLIDGREAVTFLVRIKEIIEDPSRLLFDL